MKINRAGLVIIKKWERCRLTAYKCPAGVWTIGYGHTGNVIAGDKITMAVAESLLINDCASRERFVDGLGLKLNENQFSALVSLVYNIGQGNFLKSPVYALVRVNANDPKIKEAFMRHVYANGTHDGKDNDNDGLIDEPGEYFKLDGLAYRRNDEIKLYYTPC